MIEVSKTKYQKTSVDQCFPRYRIGKLCWGNPAIPKMYHWVTQVGIQPITLLGLTFGGGRRGEEEETGVDLHCH